MARIKSLDRYQKGVLLLMIAMVLVFTVLYPKTVARVGFLYRNVILIPSQENGNTVYSGKMHGEPASFIVFTDKTVEFCYGDKTYGPYIAREDPTAIPQDSEMGEFMVGLELRQGEKILFRGGVLDRGEYQLLYNEDGSIESIDSAMTRPGGIDTIEPSASVILALMAGPELTHKGEWLAWLGGVFVCIVAAISILFADELFRYRLSYRIRNADLAEASDWEISSRYLSWAVLLIVAMLFFIFGLF